MISNEGIYITIEEDKEEEKKRRIKKKLSEKGS